MFSTNSADSKNFDDFVVFDENPFIHAETVLRPNSLQSGIEIKSDADSYTRLTAQVRNCDKYYDENYLVAGSIHAHHAAEHVTEYRGIISAELIRGQVDFYRIREAMTRGHFITVRE